MRAVLLLVVFAACSMRQVTGSRAAADAFGATAADFAQVRKGMTQSEVQVLLGPPHAVDARVSAGAALFGAGPDAWGYVYRWEGAGSVTFSCSVWNRDCTAVELEPAN